MGDVSDPNHKNFHVDQKQIVFIAYNYALVRLFTRSFNDFTDNSLEIIDN
jgi:hypothetical protein